MYKYIALIIFLFSAAEIFSQVSAGQRQIGMQVDLAENDNYDSAIYYSQKACAKYVHISLSWKEMEPQPTKIGGPTYDLLDIINFYYPSVNLKVELNIPVLNTVKREVPSDLENAAFNNTVFIKRFKVLLDSVFKKMPVTELVALNIGNESDGVFGTNTTMVTQYKEFFDSAKAYAKTEYFKIHGKELMVGTTMGFDGLTATSTSNLLKKLNQDADVISVTYYGINSDFTVKAPEDVIADFGKLVTTYPDQPIHFVECGYPSSTSCNSSEEKQKLFVENVFKAWDQNAAHIPNVTFFSLTEWSQKEVDDLAVYYGLPNDAKFKGYLGTLGMRTFPGNGKSKSAYLALQCQANQRSFCKTSCLLTAVEEKNAEAELSIYPVPANDFLTLELGKGTWTLQVHNIQGKLIGNYMDVPEVFILNTNPLNSGLYYLTAISESHSLQRKFTILK